MPEADRLKMIHPKEYAQPRIVTEDTDEKAIPHSTLSHAYSYGAKFCDKN